MREDRKEKGRMDQEGIGMGQGREGYWEPCERECS